MAPEQETEQRGGQGSLPNQIFLRMALCLIISCLIVMVHLSIVRGRLPRKARDKALEALEAITVEANQLRRNRFHDL